MAKLNTPPLPPPIKEDDGITHINIDQGAKEELGRMLSHFYDDAPFIHPHFGPFNSMEGFWHYIKTLEVDDRLRTLPGADAHALGKSLTTCLVRNFYAYINEANFYKIEQNEQLKKLMMESTLPFDYYYLFGAAKLPIRPRSALPLIEGFTEIRNMLKENRRPPTIDYTQFSSRN
jgi:hypothetical protein